MNPWELRRAIPAEEFDSLGLRRLLSGYADPEDKISELLAKHVIVRIKQGIYIFGPDYSNGFASTMVLANMIYGPSAISLEYALSHYQLIPERVVTITSVTIKRNKQFDTPLGRFSYRYLHPDRYAVGLTLTKVEGSGFAIIATPEKALADLIFFRLDRNELQSLDDVSSYLLDDLRIDENELAKFRCDRLQTISRAYNSSNVTFLCDYLMGAQDD